MGRVRFLEDAVRLEMKGRLPAESGLKRKNGSYSTWLILCYHTLLEYFTSKLPRENICEVIKIFLYEILMTVLQKSFDAVAVSFHRAPSCGFQWFYNGFSMHLKPPHSINFYWQLQRSHCRDLVNLNPKCLKCNKKGFPYVIIFRRTWFLKVQVWQCWVNRTLPFPGNQFYFT